MSVIARDHLPISNTPIGTRDKSTFQLYHILFQVFPGLLQCLPLKEDFEENHPVYSCIIELFSDQHPLIRQCLPQILAVFSQVLPSGTLQEGRFVKKKLPEKITNHLIITLIVTVAVCEPVVFAAFL